MYYAEGNVTYLDKKFRSFCLERAAVLRSTDGTGCGKKWQKMCLDREVETRA